MQDGARSGDTVCRYGGEEFTLILPDATLRDAATVAERIRRGFADRSFRPRSGEQVSSTVSVGAAQLRPNETAADLIMRADAALYQAKEAGRNRVASSIPGTDSCTK